MKKEQKLSREERRELWNSSPEYRKQIVRGLEKAGSIRRLDGVAFREVIY